MMFSALFKINSLKRFVALLYGIVFSACYWAETEENPDYLPMDDSMYPYAGLPRLVIEIENFAGLRDRETEFPSKLQIYGKNPPKAKFWN